MWSSMEYISFDDNDIASDLLAILLETAPPPPIAQYPCKSGELNKSDRLGRIEFRSPTKGYRNLLLYQFQKDHVVTAFQTQVVKNVFFNEVCLSPVYRGMFGLILTDNIFVADKVIKLYPWNNFYNRCRFTWLSFYCDETDWQMLDWHLLKKQNVFYYLVQHSGLSERQIWERANRVLDLLQRADVGCVTFIYYAPGDNVPMFMSEENFLKNIEKIYSAEVEPLPYSVCQECPRPPRKYLLSPLLYERTVLLFHSGKSSDRTQLMLDFAVAASQGKHAVSSWAPPRPVKTAYIHLNSEQTSFETELKKSLLSCFPSLQGHLQEPSPTTFPPDANELAFQLMSQQVFKSYPASTCLNSSYIQGNFFYYSTTCEAIDLSQLVNILNVLPKDVEFLVLDIPFIFSVVDKCWAKFNQILFVLRQTCAVMIGAEQYSSAMARNVNNLPLDKIIKLQRLPAEAPETLLLECTLERCDHRGNGRISTSFKLKKSKKLWVNVRIQGNKKSSIIRVIASNSGKTARELALQCGVSESYIKKLKRENGLTKSMPARAPKQPRKNLKNPYSL